MSSPEQRMQLTPGNRYRCFGPGIDHDSVCRLAATRCAPDPTRDDALTFYCELHAPKGSAAIDENAPYLAVEVAAVLTLGAATMRGPDAMARARRLLAGALADIGVSFVPIGTTAGGIAPRVFDVGHPHRSDS